MRQKVGEKKVKRYAEATGLPVVSAMVRGNTHHRVDLFVEDGAIYYYYPKSGILKKSEVRAWVPPKII